MPLGLGSALWACVLPIDETNIFLNSSWEFGNAGAVAIQSATLGTSSGFQRFGAWSLSVTPNSNGTSGVNCGTITTGNGTTYSVSAWVLGANGVAMRMGLGDNAGLNLTSGTTTFTGGGTWQYYSCTLTEAAQGTRGLVVQKTSGASVAPFYVDGVKISPWTDGIDRQTTYFDGDTNGGTWTGAQHASTSTRTGQYRGGGSIIALADLGLQVDQMLGVGMPPVENSSQSYAVVDGAQFQRTRAASRHFTLTAKPIVGTSLGDFHVTRRTLIDAFKPDLVGQQQPVRLMYYGGQGTVQIDAYYEKGLELGNMDGPIAENAAISFAAYDPYWYAPTQQGTTLSPRTAIGSMNYMAKRSPLGKWGSVGQAGGPNGVVNNLLLSPIGTLFAAGSFTTVDGTAGGRFLAQYIPATNTWGTLIGGTVNDQAGAMAYSPSGTLFFGGLFTTVAGTVGGRNLGRWANNAFGTLQGGTVAGGANTLIYSPTGTLFVGGNFTTCAGTTSGPLVIWTGAQFGTLLGGSLSNPTGAFVSGLLYAQDRSLYAGGSFNRAAGTLTNHVARYINGAWGTMGSGVGDAIGIAAAAVGDIKQGPNGVVYVSGLFGTAGGIVTNNIAQWNGVALTQLSSGGVGSTGIISFVHRMTINQQTGVLLAVGTGWGGSAGPINVPDNQAVWNGYSWLPLDIDLTTGDGDVFVGVYDNTNTLYLGGTFVGTAQAASVGTIVNTGHGACYPTMRLRNVSTGTARLYQLLNTTTGNGIYFNYSMLPSEQLTLTLQPGTRSFQSSSFGNILNSVLPGSNLATFSLLAGTNYISFFSDNDSLEASFFWQPRGWSIDSGTTT